MERKKFLISAGAGIFSMAILSKIPFLKSVRINRNEEKKVKVVLNPLAISRKKTGANNV